MKKLFLILGLVVTVNCFSQGVPTQEMIDSGKSRVRQFVFGPGSGVIPRGTVTQTGNKTTAVTLDKMSGRITMANSALAAGAEVSFVVNNSVVQGTDIIIVNIQGGGTAGAYLISVGSISNGSFTITVSNVSTGSLSQAVAINFLVINGG